MITTCPKCGHTRSADDDPAIPEGQCPACGVFYFKYLNQKSGGPRAQAPKPKPAATERPPEPPSPLIQLKTNSEKKPTTLKTYILGGIFMSIVFTVVFEKVEVANHPQELSQTETVNTTTAIKNPTQPINLSPWSYSENQDKMGRGLIKAAYTQSLNQIEFSFPYQGPQYASLVFRQRPNNNHDIALILNKAHFLCHTDECDVTVRFDDNPPEPYPASKPQDLSTNMLFIGHEYPFLSSIKNAKKLRIEASFFRHGNSVFEFNVGDLIWDYPTK
jgi:predicted  nucleic acid-binding Zn-ribbon protein